MMISCRMRLPELTMRVSIFLCIHSYVKAAGQSGLSLSVAQSSLSMAEQPFRPTCKLKSIAAQHARNRLRTDNKHTADRAPHHTCRVLQRAFR